MHSKSLSLAVLPELWEHAGFGLYVHWPFCQAKCPYCDFNSYVSDKIDENRWKEAYLAEIRRVGALTEGRILKSIFFGGGTPSLMSADLVDAIIAEVRKTWRTHNDVEITLEANPTSVEYERFAAFRDAGVNRVSLGVQALKDDDLKALGRLHGVDESLRALETAQTHFDRVSFDLIYARQNQSLADWEVELRQALAFGTDHLSLYQLTIEDGTAFGDRFAAGKLRGLPDDDLSADMFLMTQEMCEAAGLPAYETSNHARAGHEGQHNLIYWKSGDYAGIGPGAHGRLTLNGQRFATETHRAPVAWLNHTLQSGSGELPVVLLEGSEARTEYLLMGLRLREGVAWDHLAALSANAVIPRMRELEKDGWMASDSTRFWVTAQGRPVLNGVLRALLADY